MDGTEKISPIEQEKEFLTPDLEKAKAGQILEIGAIHQAYQQRLGRAAGKSTVYEMLHRHNWPKATPRPPPNAEEEAQEGFKKLPRSDKPGLNSRQEKWSSLTGYA